MKPTFYETYARGELAHAIQVVNDARPGAGRKLLEAVLAMVESIRENPGLGVRFRRTTFRFRKLKRYSYIIYYEELVDRIQIIAIAHSKQRPGYWLNRERD